MKFPARDRVIYDPNPLVSVICQISFPRILAIDHELPVAFQQKLTDAFPLLETQEAQNASDASDKAEGVGPRSMVYEFKSVEGDVAIVLGADFLGIRTTRYVKWEEFREHILTAIKTLLENYSPRVFTAISLNYINIIGRERLGLTGVPWRELIQPALIGAMAYEMIPEEDVNSYFAGTEIRIENGVVRITGAIVSKGEAHPDEFMIDNQFVSEKALDANEHQSLEYLNRFNVESGRVFQWCIKPRLHDALHPGKDGRSVER